MHLKLTEFKEVLLSREALSEEEAWKIHTLYGNQVALDWPTPLSGNRWRLQALGYVGFLPLSPERGLLLEPKVLLRNLFAMLEYAFDLRVMAGGFECDSIPEFFSRIAMLLLRKIMARARTGLYREYRDERELLGAVRGRLMVNALFNGPPRTQVECEFAEQTADLEENQIIAWTLHVLLMTGMFTGPVLEQLRKADKMFRGTISLRPFKGSQCVGRSYNRLNADYGDIHLLCRFFLDCVGPTHQEGDRRMVPFLVDMARLFEVFLAKWMEANLPGGLRIKAQECRNYGEGGTLSLNPDLVVYSSESKAAVCVLDTKYKAKGEVSNADYSQVLAYADALGCGNAFLVYPKRLERAFNVMPGRIRVQSAVFDLGLDLDSAGKAFLAEIGLSD